MRLFLFLTLIFTALTPIEPIERPMIAFWNVGQGHWATLIHNAGCVHFDMGGEWPPKSEKLNLCRKKPNALALSHADWDHMNLIYIGRRRFRTLCLIAPPREKLSPSKKRTLGRLPFCFPKTLNILNSALKVKEIEFDIQQKGDNNLHSRIYQAMGRVLLPGDSPMRMERIWMHTIEEKKSIKILSLGHHGSRTSTSKELLEGLMGLTMTVSSSRQRVYGHPHPVVQKKVRQRGVPLLKTELWGNILIQL